MRLENNMIENESKFLSYVLYVLKDSRTKKRAEARILGLVNKRLEVLGNCNVYTDEMIKDYISEKENEINEKT